MLSTIFPVTHDGYAAWIPVHFDIKTGTFRLQENKSIWIQFPRRGLGLADTFRLFEQEAESYSWWDCRAAGFRRNRGLRIDLVLASQALADNCRACSIDKEPRRLERPSDHTPIMAEFEL